VVGWPIRWDSGLLTPHFDNTIDFTEVTIISCPECGENIEEEEEKG